MMVLWPVRVHVVALRTQFANWNHLCRGNSDLGGTALSELSFYFAWSHILPLM